MIDPLTPSDCDLRDFQFMSLDVVRLRDSDLASLESPEACWAAVLLWCASWHQVPSASLPDDDRILSNLAGYGRVVAEWRKIREGALRGWIKCSDGRLYHPVVAEKAHEAWDRKLKHSFLKSCDRIRKENKNLTEKDLPTLPFPTFEEWKAARIPTEIIKIPPENKEIPKENFDLPKEKEIIPKEIKRVSEKIPLENTLIRQGEDRDREKIGIGRREDKEPLKPTTVGFNTTQKIKSKPKIVAPPLALPEFVNPDLWRNFCNFREKLNQRDHPWTQIAHDVNLKKIIGFHNAGYDVNGVIETTLANGWKSFFEPKQGFKQRGAFEEVNGHFLSPEGAATARAAMSWIDEEKGISNESK